MAVVFAMLTSYLLSRTLVPTMVHYLLESEVELYGGVEQEGVEHKHTARDPPHPLPSARCSGRSNGRAVAAIVLAIAAWSGFFRRHYAAGSSDHLPSFVTDLGPIKG
jgi:multidrug efflux pump subunit AcrB